MLATVLLAALVAGPAMASAIGAPSGGAEPDAGLAEAPGASLAQLVDHLPIVIEDLPAASDRDAIAAYRRATVRSFESLGELFDLSFDAIVVVGEADTAAVGALRDAFAEEPDSLTATSGRPVIEAALRALDADPRNLDRLNNAVIAVWLAGVASAVDTSDSYYWHLQQASAAVILETNRLFPGRRPTLLNAAFLTTVMPGLGFSGEPYAEEALALDPADVTARALLASIQSRRADAIDGADRATTTLAPLVDDPATAALGEALVGDAHLAAATIRRAEAPASSLRHANLAIAAYDRAMGLSQDPALRAGRAKALERLDQLDAAVAEQTAVAEAVSGSLDPFVELGRLQHRAGDVEGLRASAMEAVTSVVRGWDPPISELRFVTAPLDDPVPEDRGFLGWSVGSAVDHLPVAPRGDLGSGAGVVVVATIPREPPGIDHRLFAQFGPRNAWELAFDGAILAGDADEATSLAATWDRSAPWRGGWDFFLEAADLAAGEEAAGSDASPAAVNLAETVFRRAGQFAGAADLCRRAEDPECTGENEFHANQAAAAMTDLRAAYEAALDDDDGPSPKLRMLMAAAAEAAEDLPTAEAFLAMTAGANDSGSWRPVAALRAGDLRLAAHDANGAIAWYDLALATIEANGLAESRDYHADLTGALEFRGLRQAAHNNRAVALLRSLQPDEETAPACDPGAAQQRCETALADIRAASASDPQNAVYRMNEGWVLRLLGRADEARAALETAVQLEPTLYPAFNDLGILLALDGDHVGARAAFSAAMAAEPAYDLARWNLGILALRDVPGGIVEGQRSLAEAIRLQPSLRTAPLEFRADDQTYTFRFEAPLPPPAGATLGRTYSLGAVVLGSAASVAALVQLQSTLFGHGVKTAIGGTQARLERLGKGRRWRARQRAFRQRLPAGLRGLLPWIGVALLLVVVTGWQAAQASPTTWGAAIVLAVLATLLALVAHWLGHAVAARAMKGTLIPAAWAPGAIVALLFLPVQAATGPFLAERIRRERGGESGAWRFHIAGPLANALVGIAAYVLFLLEPMPAFRLVAQVQLAAISYTLLPVRPLDGWALQREQPRLLLALGFGVVAAGAAFALGLI